MNDVETKKMEKKSSLKTKDIVYIGIFAALMAICSWISIPMTVPFTLQTFAVFLAVALLGGKRGTISVVVYMLLGAIGIPVFSGFQGGLGYMFGTTGGYLLGFILTALIMWGFEAILGRKPVIQMISMVLGLIACYAMGTVWFMVLYSKANGPVSLMTVLGWCVIPFIIPDLCKAFLALFLARKLYRFV